MFEKPRNGWTDILIGDFEGLGSYIQDIPVECMQAFTEGLRNNTPVKLHFDEEGSAFTVVIDGDMTNITAESVYGPEEYTYPLSVLTLAKEVLADMEEHFTEWVEWPEEYAYFEEDEQAEKLTFFEERKAMLEALLEEFKAEINRK